MAKRPLLPAWQRECLKNYEEKQHEFTKSENLSRLVDTPITYSQINTRSTSDIRLQNIFRPIDGVEDIGESFKWDDALSSPHTERVIYDDQSNFDSDVELRANRFETITADRYCEDDASVLSQAFSAPDYRLASTLPPLSVSRTIGQSDTKNDSTLCFEKDIVTDVDEKPVKRPSTKDSWSVDSARKKNRSFDFPKSKIRGHSSGGGLLQAVAYFENLDKGAAVERPFGRSSLKSFKSRDSGASKTYESQPPLRVSPFQLDISNKSDKCLRELERKAEAQYKDIKEKLGESSLDSIEMAKLGPVDNLPMTASRTSKFEKLAARDSGYSTTGLRNECTTNDAGKSENPLLTSRAKFGAKIGGLDGLNCGENARTTTHRIVVTKNEYDEDFGFSISERVDGRGIYVKTIQASTGRSGKLKKYDRLLQVRNLNSYSLQ